MIAWAGEDWAPPGGSRVRVRLERPMGSCSRVRVRGLCPAATVNPMMLLMVLRAQGSRM
jgi:hypothetical protein